MRNDPASHAERPVTPALINGLRRRCPRCGKGALFQGFLSVRPHCPECGESMTAQRADDAPAWATMVIVGHLMIPLILTARGIEGVPVWAHMVIWPAVALALCLALLPSVKGAVIAVQWALRMHGFDDARAQARQTGAPQSPEPRQ